MTRYCIFHKKPWYVLNWVYANNYENAMKQAVAKYDKFPHFLKREMLEIAPSMYQDRVQETKINGGE